MRYEKFEIRNFKGIRHATLDLSSLTGANVFALVGLNESGKTTILEAIHSFSPDNRALTLMKSGDASEKDLAESRVPRHLIASFSEEIVVSATVSIKASDRDDISDYLETEYNLIIDKPSIPDHVALSRADVFSRGDYQKTVRRLDFSPQVKTKGQRKFRNASKEECLSVWLAVWNEAPDIAYYPTFTFDFPDRIYLTLRQGKYDSFYAGVFSDILSVDGQGYTLDDIRRRIRSETFTTPWVKFFPSWMTGDDRGKVQQIIDRASATVTKHVLGKWNKIFGENVKGREITIGYDVEEGRVYNKETRTYQASEKHDIYIWFEIKDGTRRFRVNDRSLGFRWFFAFLLFTQFRVSKSSGRNVMFLFDEPASNLHAAAQQKLIESFPEIAGRKNMLLYTTHSHYMIDPAWLEQTFIVTNRSDTPVESIFDTALLDDESLDIQAQRYRKFVNDNPSETSYFQPIVDRLDVVPSKFDYNLPSVVVEGKSDYYILSYAQMIFEKDSLRLLPAGGSGTFGALISLGVGWGIKFLFLLDSDGAGDKEKERYTNEMGVRSAALVSLGECLAGCNEIEDVLDDEAKSIICRELDIDGKLSKKHIQRFFQENLARRSSIHLGTQFEQNSKRLLECLESKLDSL